jgi:hypothetical protein
LGQDAFGGSGTGGFLNGGLDDVRVYRIALSAEQIDAVVNYDSDDLYEFPDWWEYRYFRQLGINP